MKHQSEEVERYTPDQSTCLEHNAQISAPVATGESETVIAMPGSEVPQEVEESARAVIEVKTSGVVITIRPDEAEPQIVVECGDHAVVQVVRFKKVGTVKRQIPLAAAPHVRISKVAFKKLQETVGSLPAERGGIFVGSAAFCIEDFIFDEGTNASRSAVYYPDTEYLNTILERDHEPHGRRFVGLAHSHPSGYWHPSGDAKWGDVKAARNNLISKSNADLSAIFIPIVESAATTGTFVLHPFIMLRRDLCVRPARYEVID